MAVTIAAGDIAVENDGACRSIVRTSLGVIWVAIDDGSNVDFWYSTDNGSTWTEDTSATLTSREGWGLAVDGSDNLHLHTEADGGGTPRYHWGVLNAGHTAITWTTVTGLSSSIQDGDVVGYMSGGVSVGIVMGVPATGSFRFDRFNDGVNTGTAPPNTSTGGSGPSDSALAFHHTGDGYTVAGSTPHLYLAFTRSSGAYFQKATFAAGSWTWGAIRTLASSGVAQVEKVSFDGTRVLVLAQNSSNDLVVYERDAGDTTTTTRTPPTTGSTSSAAMAFDSYGDIHLFARDSADDDVYTVVYDRSAGTWGSWVSLEAGTYSDVDCVRGYRAARIEYVVEDATNVSHGSVALNVAPTAATWVTAPGVKDRDETLLLDWTFNDPDGGDTQSAYAMSRVVNAGSTEYLTAAGETWGGVEVKNTSTTSAVTLAATWATDGDDIDYKVKTWDAADTEGVYSAALNVDASVQVNPAVVTPADAGTVTTNTVTMTWTAAEQTAYRARLYNSGRTVTHEDSGWVTSTDLTHAFVFIITDGVGYEVGIVTKNAEGLASDEDTHTFTGDFTEPAVPRLSIAEDGDHIDLTITNPTPSGSQPDVDSNAVYARIASGGVTDGYRAVGGTGTRIAANVAENGSHVDWAAGGGYDYEYLIRADGDNGTSADSSWIRAATPTLSAATAFWVAKNGASYYDSSTDAIVDYIGTSDLQLGSTSGTSDAEDPTFGDDGTYEHLTFDGSDDYLINSSWPAVNTNDFTFVLVCQVNTGVASTAVLAGNRTLNGDGWRLYVNGGVLKAVAEDSGGDVTVVGNLVTLDTQATFAFRRSSTTSIELYQDGSTWSDTLTGDGDVDDGDFNIGRRGFGDQPALMKVYGAAYLSGSTWTDAQIALVSAELLALAAL